MSAALYMESRILGKCRLFIADDRFSSAFFIVFLAFFLYGISVSLMIFQKFIKLEAIVSITAELSFLRV